MPRRVPLAGGARGQPAGSAVKVRDETLGNVWPRDGGTGGEGGRAIAADATRSVLPTSSSSSSHLVLKKNAATKKRPRRQRQLSAVSPQPLQSRTTRRRWRASSIGSIRWPWTRPQRRRPRCRAPQGAAFPRPPQLSLSFRFAAALAPFHPLRQCRAHPWGPPGAWLSRLALGRHRQRRWRAVAGVCESRLGRLSSTATTALRGPSAPRATTPSTSLRSRQRRVTRRLAATLAAGAAGVVGLTAACSVRAS